MAVTLCITFLIAMGTGITANSQKDPDALALLRGAEAVRVKYDNLRVELDMEYADRTQRCTLPCLIEQVGFKRRFEQFAGSCPQEGIVTLIKDQEVQSYRRKQYADLDIYDMDRATGVRADIAFDPRIIGLDEITMIPDETVRRLLWIDDCDRVELLGREQINGVSMWHVKVKRNDATSEFWIEEPSFRVHKRILKEDDIRVEIHSFFDTLTPKFPFPKSVQVTREEGKKWKRLKITVKSFEVDKPIPDERFTINSIGLPVDTMINDYRINRIIGYWDGDGISKQPISPKERSSAPPTPMHGKGLLIWINLLLVLPLLVAIFWRRRRSGASAK